MMHKMKLVDFAFNAIKNKKKDIEVRLNDEKRKLINIGDVIEFTNIDTLETIKVEVTNLYKFNTFEELFKSFDHERFGLNKKDDSSIMDRFYTKEEQEKYDALGIEVRLIDIEIRKAESKDLDALNDMFKQLLEYERKNYDNNIKEDLVINSYFDKRINTDIVLVALKDSRIVGYVYGIIDGDNKIKKDLEGSIDSIFVLGEYRNQGIGRRLIDSIILEFKKSKVRYLYITNIFDNVIAKNLYEKTGFKVMRETRRKKLF